MKRLTGRNEDGDLLFRGEQLYAGDFYDAVTALENYEDTGYTPEQINALKPASEYLQDLANLDALIAGVIHGLTDENKRLRDLIEVDRKIKLETMHSFLDKYEIDYDCGWRDAMDKLIADLKAKNERLKRKQRWVPVSEGLPEDGQEVLVYARGMVHMAAFYKDDGWLYATVSSPDEEDITHWKIPDVPKEADNDQR